MARICLIVLDVLIPNNLPIDELAKAIAEENVEVDITVQEVEQKVATSKITLCGEDINFEKVREKLDKYGTSIQSVDRVVCKS